MDAIPDSEFRLDVYRSIVETGRVPAVADLVKLRGEDAASVREALSRLSGVHALVLDADGEIAMAHPFSGKPTSYAVETPQATFFANCAWDALAIPSMLGRTARIAARCACKCAEPMLLEFIDGALVSNADAVVHFAVPPRRFYDDIRFT